MASAIQKYLEQTYLHLIEYKMLHEGYTLDSIQLSIHVSTYSRAKYSRYNT